MPSPAAAIVVIAAAPAGPVGTPPPLVALSTQQMEAVVSGSAPAVAATGPALATASGSGPGMSPPPWGVQAIARDSGGASVVQAASSVAVVVVERPGR